MSYFQLGQANQEAPSAQEKEEMGRFARRLIDKPFPAPKEIAPGSPETKKPPGPTPEEIEVIYQEIRDHVGGAVIDEISYRMGAVMRGFGRDMQKNMIGMAAHDLGVGIALACAGPVGWVIGIVYTVVTIIARGANEREAKAIIANAQVEAMNMEAIWDAKMRKDQENVIREETPAAIKLALDIALSPTLPQDTIQGIGLFEDFRTKLQERRAGLTPEELEKRQRIARALAIYLGANQKAQAALTKSWENMVVSLQEQLGLKEKDRSTIEKAVDKTRAAIRKYGYSGLFAVTSGTFIPPSKEIMEKVSAWGKGAAEYMSGHIAVTKAKEVSRLVLEQAKLRIMAQYYISKKQLDDPEFRSHLRISIAQEILANPEIQKMLAGTVMARENLKQVLKQPEQAGLRSTKPKTGLLLGGGAAAALAAYFFLT